MAAQAKGPYEAQDMDNLERVNNIYTELLDEFDELREKSETSIINDSESLESLLKVAKALTDNVHKTANATSRHDIGNAMVESAEDRMEFLRELHNGASEAYVTLDDANVEEIPAELMPNPVDGQLDIGINKNTLKEIMDTNIPDDED